MTTTNCGPLRAGHAVHGDVLSVLANADANFFDTIFFDWPYSQASPVRGKDDGAAARMFGPQHFLVRALQRTKRVSRSGSHFYLLGDWRGIPDNGYAMGLSGFFPKTIIAWDKCYVGTGSFWRSSWDPIFFGSNGPAEERTDKALPNVIRVPSVRQGREHPYEKPEELWRKLCEPSVVKGKRVLDPFAGSRSSQGPVEEAGGIWYGVDVDEAYADAVLEEQERRKAEDGAREVERADRATTVVRARLTVRTDRGQPLLVLGWEDGAARVESVEKTVEGSVEQWLVSGIHEWVEDGSVTSRSTTSSDPNFLPHLEDYLARQFNFRLRLDTVVEARRT